MMIDRFKRRPANRNNRAGEEKEFPRNYVWEGINRRFGKRPCQNWQRAMPRSARDVAATGNACCRFGFYTDSKQICGIVGEVEGCLVEAALKNVSQTYLLNLTTQEFESLTLAIMLNSNKTGKLQGLGRCISQWLHQWDAGEIAIIDASSDQHLEREVDPTHQIYVGLTGDATNMFRAWRAALVNESGLPITVTRAVIVLTDCAIAHHARKKCLKYPER